MIPKKKARKALAPSDRASGVAPVPAARRRRSNDAINAEAMYLLQSRHRLLDRNDEIRLGSAFRTARRDLFDALFGAPEAARELAEIATDLRQGETHLSLVVDVDRAAESVAEDVEPGSRASRMQESLLERIDKFVRSHERAARAGNELTQAKRQRIVRLALDLHLRDEVVCELARRVKRAAAGGGDLVLSISDAERRANAARDAFVRANIGLVISIARRYVGKGLALADLVQEGNLGLMRAVEKFDPERGYRFSTYGSWWIRQSMSRALCNQSRTIRIPVHAIELNRKLARARRACELESGGRATIGELAERTGLDERQVETFSELLREPLSLDAPVSADGDASLGEFVPDQSAGPAQQAIHRDLQEQLSVLLGRLPAREQTILRLRFGLDGRGIRTLREIGEAAGVSRPPTTSASWRTTGSPRPSAPPASAGRSGSTAWRSRSSRTSSRWVGTNSIRRPPS
jgi:RNA polymerase sigma factor (sigma-70 family)